MTFLQSLLLGLVQGLSEFLPVSSSAHLILLQEFFGINGAEDADLLFSVLVHLGTLIAVFIAFRKTIWELILEAIRLVKDLFTKKFSWKEAKSARRMLIFLILSLLPLFVIYPIKSVLDPLLVSPVIAGICLIFNGAILFLADFAQNLSKNANTMTWKDALYIGCIQCVAVLPGISRSGSTITAGLTCGLKRSYAAKYSFILSIPTILGGAVLEIADAVGSGIDPSKIPVYLVGMITAMISGFFAIKLLQYILKSKRFLYFSVYCLVLGIFALIWAATH